MYICQSVILILFRGEGGLLYGVKKPIFSRTRARAHTHTRIHAHIRAHTRALRARSTHSPPRARSTFSRSRSLSHHWIVVLLFPVRLRT